MKTAWCYFPTRLRQKTNEAYILDLMLILMKNIFSFSSHSLILPGWDCKTMAVYKLGIDYKTDLTGLVLYKLRLLLLLLFL